MARKIISLTILISFLLLALSSIILYIVPEGRVAYWSNWTILGLSKSQWGNLHITSGFLFIILSLWHIVLNWKCIVNYMKKSAEKNIKSPMPLLIALLLNAFIFGGTLLGWQPMKQVLAWNGDIKKYQADKYGNPPYGHAELSSLESFCGFLGLNTDDVVSKLKEKQLKGDINKNTIIIDIANANAMTPQELYDIIRTAVSSASSSQQMPANAPEGTGKMTLNQLCFTYGLPLDSVILRLKTNNIDATGEQTIKEIGQAHDMHSHKVYELLRGE